MYRLFRSELLKSKRTLLRPTLFIGAVIFSVLLMIVANLAPDALEKSWEHYTKMIFNMWTISFNTLGITFQNCACVNCMMNTVMFAWLWTPI